VEDCTVDWPLPPRAVFQARLCLAELAGNVVEHGGPEAQAAPIAVTLAAEADGLAVEMRDAGRAFDPTRRQAEPAAALAETTITGRGLLALHRIASGLAYAREEGRNRIRFRIATG
jgi:anti-sigma regulatory factor (Ser/Thr protein kinase)